MYTTALSIALPLMGAFVSAIPIVDENPECKTDYSPIGKTTCGEWGEKDLDFHWYPIYSYKGYSENNFAFYDSMKKQICARMDFALNPNRTNVSTPFDIKAEVNQYLDYGFNTSQAFNNQTISMGTLPSGNGTLPILLNNNVLGRLSLTITPPEGQKHSFTYAKCVEALELFQKKDNCCYGKKNKDTLGGHIEFPDKTTYTVKPEALPKALASGVPIPSAAATTLAPQATPIGRSLQREVKGFGLPYKW